MRTSSSVNASRVTSAPMGPRQTYSTCAAADLVRLAPMADGGNLFATAATALCTLASASGAPDAGRTAQQVTPPSSWTPVAGRPLRQPRELRSRDGVLKARPRRPPPGDRRRRRAARGAAVQRQPRRADAARAAGRPARADDPQRHERADEHPLPRAAREADGRSRDNVFRVFEPASTVRSVVKLPRDHAPGTYWYHVHLHGSTEEQVMGGMSGPARRRRARAASCRRVPRHQRARAGAPRRPGRRRLDHHGPGPGRARQAVDLARQRPAAPAALDRAGGDAAVADRQRRAPTSSTTSRSTATASPSSPRTARPCGGRAARGTSCCRPASASTCSSRAASRGRHAFRLAPVRRGLRAPAREAARRR